MVWAKFDDQYPRHKKLLAAGAEGMALDVAAICWSNAEGTDGFIPDYALTILYPVRNHTKVAARLVEVRRWEREEGGWHIHDFHDFNPSAEEAVATREARAEAGRRGGEASAEAKRQANAAAPAEANGSANAKQNSNPVSRSKSSSNSLSRERFADFWAKYPRRVARKAAEKAWAARMREQVPAEQLITAAGNYAVTVQGKDTEFVMHPATFIGSNERWRDYLESPRLRAVGDDVYDDRPPEYR